jgi:hypothetical protein
MRHEPSCLVSDAQHPVKLMGAYSLLAGAHEMEGQHPFMQGNMAALKERSYGHAKLFLAGIAVV